MLERTLAADYGPTEPLLETVADVVLFPVLPLIDLRVGKEQEAAANLVASHLRRKVSLPLGLRQLSLPLVLRQLPLPLVPQRDLPTLQAWEQKSCHYVRGNVSLVVKASFPS